MVECAIQALMLTQNLNTPKVQDESRSLTSKVTLQQLVLDLSSYSMEKLIRGYGQITFFVILWSFYPWSYVFSVYTTLRIDKFEMRVGPRPSKLLILSGFCGPEMLNG